MKTFLWEKSTAIHSSSHCAEKVQGRAYGKVILIGEHAAVYGFPALAIPLRDVGVCIEIDLHNPIRPQNWDDAWEVWVRGKKIDLPADQRERLTLSLALAVRECRAESLQEHYHPTSLCIRSEIPLGAGMGGSAAISAALTRLVDALTQTPRTVVEVARIANLIDGFFHGNASGLDAATVVASNAIEFVRGKGSWDLNNAREFQIVLVDSRERAHTADMVALVARNREQNPTFVNAQLAQLGQLVEVAKTALREGNLNGLGHAFNRAHVTLQQLGVSTAKLDSLVELLLLQGALGAKVTGAGGGGLVLGLFEEIPAGLVTLLAQYGEVYTTCVPSNPENFLARK